jgi:hypothetical protein
MPAELRPVDACAKPKLIHFGAKLGDRFPRPSKNLARLTAPPPLEYRFCEDIKCSRMTWPI